ncbi:hypothetical protein CTAYLR_003500 [Chrysophaeum taylorii]|uniref:Protein kinase domain-containing protein n=1 Tax=Chrysophaeum taylorii TaxID=2483200 RepID=A0AAD7UCY5_9STRA|nr:hypothetical protein CTAYLR_003500 [Chrysophaeum taylorii]
MDGSSSSVGHWVLGRVVGRGATGRVYLAQLSDGLPVACKVMHTESEEERGVMMREISMVRRLRHPNIVRYHGMEIDGPRLHLFLEYAHGGSLRQLTKTVGALDRVSTRRFTAQILAGLIYLHSHGIAHRDIKGANVLLASVASPSQDYGSLVAKLADFGSSKYVVEATKVASLSGLKGTPHWMAPEVIRGQLCDGSLEDWTSADVWSVGCTVAEMLTGDVPWPQFQNPMAAMYKIAEGLPPPMPNVACSVSRSFVAACCESEPARRPTPACLLLTSNFFDDETNVEESASSCCNHVARAMLRYHRREKKKKKNRRGDAGRGSLLLPRGQETSSSSLRAVHPGLPPIKAPPPPPPPPPPPLQQQQRDGPRRQRLVDPYKQRRYARQSRSAGLANAGTQLPPLRSERRLVTTAPTSLGFPHHHHGSQNSRASLVDSPRKSSSHEEGYHCASRRRARRWRPGHYHHLFAAPPAPSVVA